MENEKNLEVAEQVEFIGKEIEKKIFEGKAEIIGEPERLWLKSLMEKRGVNFELIGSKDPEANHSNTHNEVEPNELVRAFGGVEKFVKVVQLAMEKVTTENNLYKLPGFVEKYLTEHTDEFAVIRLNLNSGDINDAKIVGVISALHRILKILKCSDQQTALEVQANHQTTILLRERMLRRNKNTETVNSESFEVQRVSGNEKLRTLAGNGVEAILSSLVSLEEI